jgi:hypothetical protein
VAVESHGDADQIGFAIVGLVIIAVARAELLACPEHMIEQLRRMGYEPGTLEQAEISFFDLEYGEGRLYILFASPARWLNHVPSGPSPRVCDLHHHGCNKP